MSIAIVAAPGSGAGKTTVTLGLLRAMRRCGVPVRSAKIGPDYIDPRFHEAATGRPCPNLDPWAMPLNRLESLMAGDGPLLIEAAMGLFDGAGLSRNGSAEHLARSFDIPIILVVDCARAGASVAAQVFGMVAYNPDLRFAGLILNRVGSDRHEAILRRALSLPAPGGRLPPMIGVLRRDAALTQPSRHLGLVQAEERDDLETWLDTVADRVEAGCNPDAVFPPANWTPRNLSVPGIAPLGQRIAVARDRAFAFQYPHLLDDWRRMGAEIVPFSPLADDAVPQADAVFLPGGYPELHAGRIAANLRFMNSLRNAAQTAVIYGECGGYMVLGDGLTDAEGVRHEMAGLLRLETSFATRKLHLGYRVLRAEGGPFTGHYTAHEFHYSTELRAEGTPLFHATDSDWTEIGAMGLQSGRVCGSYAHLIDRADHVLQTRADAHGHVTQ